MRSLQSWFVVDFCLELFVGIDRNELLKFMFIAVLHRFSSKWRRSLFLYRMCGRLLSKHGWLSSMFTMHRRFVSIFLSVDWLGCWRLTSLIARFSPFNCSSSSLSRTQATSPILRTPQRAMPVAWARSLPCSAQSNVFLVRFVRHSDASPNWEYFKSNCRFCFFLPLLLINVVIVFVCVAWPFQCLYGARELSAVLSRQVWQWNGCLVLPRLRTRSVLISSRWQLVHLSLSFVSSCFVRVSKFFEVALFFGLTLFLIFFKVGTKMFPDFPIVGNAKLVFILFRPPPVNALHVELANLWTWLDRFPIFVFSFWMTWKKLEQTCTAFLNETDCALVRLFLSSICFGLMHARHFATSVRKGMLKVWWVKIAASLVQLVRDAFLSPHWIGWIEYLFCEIGTYTNEFEQGICIKCSPGYFGGFQGVRFRIFVPFWVLDPLSFLLAD